MFTQSPQMLRHKNIKLERETCLVNYLECPRCEEKYIIAVHDKLTKKLTKSITALDKKLSRVPLTDEQLKKHDEMIKERQTLLFTRKQRQRELNRSVTLN